MIQDRGGTAVRIPGSLAIVTGVLVSSEVGVPLTLDLYYPVALRRHGMFKKNDEGFGDDKRKTEQHEHRKRGSQGAVYFLELFSPLPPRKMPGKVIPVIFPSVSLLGVHLFIRAFIYSLETY